ncbi:MAG: glycosyl hydrolase family 28-related protein [Pseudomonadota bacterium]
MQTIKVGSFFIRTIIATMATLFIMVPEILAQTKVVVIPLGGDDIVPLQNVIRVAKNGGDFDNPSTAIESLSANLVGEQEVSQTVVFIAPGDYVLSNQVVLPANVHLVGSGMNNTRLLSSQSSNASREAGAALVLERDSLISNLTLVSENGAQTQTVGIYSDQVSAPGGESTGAIVENVSVVVKGFNSVGAAIVAQGAEMHLNSVQVYVGDGGSTSTGLLVDSNAKVRVINSSVVLDLNGANGGTGIYALSGSELEVSNANINVSGGGGVLRAAYGELAERIDILHSTLVVDGQGFQDGVLNFKSHIDLKDSRVIVSDFSSVQSKVGIRNSGSSPFPTFYVSASHIIAPTTVEAGANGFGSSTSFITDSVLDGAVPTGDVRCDFVFTSAGTELDSTCGAGS